LTQLDLADIWAFIADDSENAADLFLDSIYTTFKPLLEMPKIGAPRDEFAPGLRVVFHK